MKRIQQIFLMAYLLLAASLVSASPPLPLKDWEIAGFVAALKDPDDDVVRAALEYPRAREILATEIKLECGDIKRVAGILSKEFEKRDVIPLLTADSRIAVSAQEQIAKQLSSDSAEVRKRSIQFFLEKPNLGIAYIKMLTNRLGDEDDGVRGATYDLLKKQPQLFYLTDVQLIDWLTDESNRGKRLGAMWFIEQKPELIKPEHTTALTNRLGDDEYFVHNTAFFFTGKTTAAI